MEKAPVEGPGLVLLNGELANGVAVGVAVDVSLTGVAAVGAGLGGTEVDGSEEGVGGVGARFSARSRVVGGLGGREPPNTEEPTPPGLGDLGSGVVSSTLTATDTGSVLGALKGDGAPEKAENAVCDGSVLTSGKGGAGVGARAGVGSVFETPKADVPP